jgi:AbrB family looped-hinge helix DNA binding protein
MSTLTVTAKGQVTLRKDILDHLGVAPGARVNVEKLPEGRVEVRAAPAAEISAVFGMLRKKGGPVLSIERMNEIARQGWSGKGGKKK